jgi:hypothetical protein
LVVVDIRVEEAVESIHIVEEVADKMDLEVDRAVDRKVVEWAAGGNNNSNNPNNLVNHLYMIFADMVQSEVVHMVIIVEKHTA